MLCTVINMLTPYQGQGRCMGYYICRQCNRDWSSANSWANYGQKCNSCYTNVMPLVLRPLEPGPILKLNGLDKSDPYKAHKQELCGKCQSLGRFFGRK